jgi:hypothetical protein
VNAVNVGAVERSEAAIFALTLESQAKDQKIAAFGSSYKGNAFQMQELPKAAIF